MFVSNKHDLKQPIFKFRTFFLIAKPVMNTIPVVRDLRGFPAMADAISGRKCVRDVTSVQTIGPLAEVRVLG